MSYSPTQLAAFSDLAARRKRREDLQRYQIARAAYHADKKGDAKIRKELGG